MKEKQQRLSGWNLGSRMIIALSLAGCSVTPSQSWPAPSSRVPISFDVPNTNAAIFETVHERFHYVARYAGFEVGHATLLSHWNCDGRIWMKARGETSGLGKLIFPLACEFVSEIDGRSRRPEWFQFKIDNDETLVPSRVLLDRERGVAQLERVSHTAVEVFYLEINDPDDLLSFFVELRQLSLDVGVRRTFELVGPTGRFSVVVEGIPSETLTLDSKTWLDCRRFQVSVLGSEAPIPANEELGNRIQASYRLWLPKEIGAPPLRLERELSMGTLIADLCLDSHSTAKNP